jgi:polyphosphate kinase 2 (PPK2 family)
MILDRVDLGKSLPKKEYLNKVPALKERLRRLEFLIYEKRLAVVVVMEGWDAAGKGGTIKRLTEHLDPRGYSVHSYAAPQGEEKTHHYLWRFWRNLPKGGHIAVFDRSWYGRVLVERVEGLCPPETWKRAFQEINEFEWNMASFGTAISKLWLHISPEEQEGRFRSREADPFKNYKLTDEDWRNRQKWSAYEEAAEEMILRTSTLYAPWTVVPANDKYYARIACLEAVALTIESQLEKGMPARKIGHPGALGAAVE